MYIRLRDLVASIMIKEKKTEVGAASVDAFARNVQKCLGRDGLVDYESASFHEFASRNPEFDYEGGIFSLKKGYGLDWLTANVSENMSVEVMDALGLLDDENESSN